MSARQQAMAAPRSAADRLATVDPHTRLKALECGASYVSGGIGALVQPLIVERVFWTLKPNFR